MPTNSYICKECGFIDEYIEGAQTSQENHHPEICPKCKKGKLEKIFDLAGSHGGFDIIGYCYENIYGKKNWKKGKTQNEIAKCLAPDPITGKFSDPY